MSSSFRGYLSGLFGCEERSDCTILFCCQASLKEEPEVSNAASTTRAAKRQREANVDRDGQPVVEADGSGGHPIPAHMLVICGGSPLLRAQADRWTQQQGPESRPVLRIALNTPEERPLALTALRFIYTDKLDVSGAKQLLGVRRLAGYLQVEGCVEACDAALDALITASAAQPLQGVAELFQYRHLLPDGDGDGDRAVVQRALHACREQLKRHAGELNPEDRVTAGGPSWGEVLAWAFLDAPSLLSDRSVLKQLCALPVRALGALLWCDSFATDDEATVLLVLAHWLQANPSTSIVLRDWLCRMIRLSQLSATYLHVVLPEIRWFSIVPAEYRFICAYSRANPAKRKSMKEALGTEFNFSNSMWYSERRPESGKRAVTSYTWHVTEQELRAALLSTTLATVFLYGTFSDGSQAAASYGFEWRVLIGVDKGEGTAGVFLHCQLPAGLQVASSASVVDVVSPGPVSLVAYKWRGDGSREEALNETFGSMFIQISKSLGYPGVLKAKPLADEQRNGGTGEQSLLAPWAPFLKEGKLHGALNWR